MAGSLVGCVLALTACSPGIAGFIGLAKAGSDYRVFVAMCDGETIDHVDIRDRAQVNAQSEYAVVGEIRVLRVGKVLASDIISEESARDELFAGSRFMLSAPGPSLFPSVVSGMVFTYDDLLALNESEVLTVDPSTWGKTTVADLDAFTKLIEDEWCELGSS